MHCLIAIFQKGEIPKQDMSLFKNKFIKSLCNYKTRASPGAPSKGFRELCFNKVGTSVSMVECKCLVLKLFAAGILVPQVDGTDLRPTLAYDECGNPLMNDISRWIGFKFC